MPSSLLFCVYSAASSCCAALIRASVAILSALPSGLSWCFRSSARSRRTMQPDTLQPRRECRCLVDPPGAGCLVSAQYQPRQQERGQKKRMQDDPAPSDPIGRSTPCSASRYSSTSSPALLAFQSSSDTPISARRRSFTSALTDVPFLCA